MSMRRCERCFDRTDDVEMTECGFPCGPHRWCPTCRRVTKLMNKGLTPTDAQEFVDKECTNG